jgi:rhamnosyltransferase subunit B
MARILLTTFGSLGDLHPFIGIGLALQKAGHTVRIGTNHKHVSRVQQAGLEAHPIGVPLDPEDPELVRVVLNSRTGSQTLHKKYIFPYIGQSIQDSLPLAKESDLILTGTIGYFVPTVAELAKIPWGSVVLSPVLFWSAIDPPEIDAIPILRPTRHLGPWATRAVYKLMSQVTRNLSRPLQKRRLELGLKEQENPMSPKMFNHGLTTIAFFSKHFAPRQNDWPQNLVQPGYIHFDGAGADQNLSTEIQDFLKKGEAPILLTLGSTQVSHPGRIYEIFSKVIADTKKRAILLVGKDRLREFRQLYQNSDLGVFDYAPFSKLMPQCVAVVHQGGAGTTGRCLSSGKPAVIIASATDQLDNARHVEEIGCGVKLHLRKLSFINLKNAIEQATSKQVIQKSKDIGHLISQESAETFAVQHIEKILREKRS